MLKPIVFAAAALLWLATPQAQAAQPLQSQALASEAGVLELVHGRKAKRPPSGRHHWHRPPPRHHHWRPGPPPRRHYHHHYRPRPQPRPQYHYYQHYHPAPRGGLHFHFTVPN